MAKVGEVDRKTGRLNAGKQRMTVTPSGASEVQQERFGEPRMQGRGSKIGRGVRAVGRAAGRLFKRRGRRSA